MTALAVPKLSKQRNRDLTLRMSAISVLWTVLSVIFTGGCSLAVISPFWFERLPDPDAPPTDSNSSFIAFGLLRFCVKQNIESALQIHEWKDFKDCKFYNSFDGVPSLFWKFSVVLYAMGAMLAILAVVLAYISCCCKWMCGKSVFAVAGFMQAIAVLCLAISLVMFPLGLTTQFVTQYCGVTGLYNPGQCEISWAYTLAIMSTALLIFCPLLARHLTLMTPRSKATVV